MDRTTQEPRPDPLVGAVVERYRVVERIAEGSSSAVYRVVHLQTRAELAMKILFEDLATSAVSVERFKREAQAASRIKHPNVVAIVDFGTTDSGMSFLVMEMIRGRTLQEHLQDDGVMAPARAANIARQLAAGLVEAHARGFVHRDLKPANVMLEPAPDGERAKILDFGLVRRQEPAPGERRVTRAGLTVGTPAYMAPEQCMDGEITGQADLYALGCILYEMLAGRPPFEGNAQEVLAKHIVDRPAPLHTKGALEDLAFALLEKVPGKRPKGALTVMRELERIASSFPETVLGRLSRSAEARLESDGKMTLEELDHDESSHTHVGPTSIHFDEETLQAGPGRMDDGDGLGASTLSDIPLTRPEETDRGGRQPAKAPEPEETSDLHRRPRTQVLDLTGLDLEQTRNLSPLAGGASEVTMLPAKEAVTIVPPGAAEEAPRGISSTAKVLLVSAFILGAGALAATLIALETTVLWPSIEIGSDPPGATIVLDGHPIPETSPHRVKVPPRIPHSVAVELAGYGRQEESGPLRLGYGEVRVVWLRFPTPPRLVRVRPVGARVLVDGVHAGTGTEIALHDLPRDRPITVRVEAEGRPPWTRTFASGAEVPAELEVILGQ